MRLLAHYDYTEAELHEYQGFLIGRLFEEGESRDLNWLTGCIREEELLSWLRTHGGRQLSRRTLAFWSTLLRAVDATADRPPETDELWPL